MPGLTVDLPALAEKDYADLEWGLSVGRIDYIAASFIRKPQDVLDIRAFCQRYIQEKKLKMEAPLIISKIESTEGLRNFTQILGK